MGPEPGESAGTLVAERAYEAGVVGFPEEIVLPAAGELELCVMAVVHVHTTAATLGFFLPCG
jgi:hypothetical protein